MLFKVTADKFDYDQYDSFIVVADSEEEALNIIDERLLDDLYYEFAFLEPQTWSAEQIDIDSLESGIIHESFNAG